MRWEVWGGREYRICYKAQPLTISHNTNIVSTYTHLQSQPPSCLFRTATTEDGKRSAQFEHQLIITKDGCEILTARTKDSPPLWWEESEDQRLARQTKDALNVA